MAAACSQADDVYVGLNPLVQVGDWMRKCVMAVDSATIDDISA